MSKRIFRSIILSATAVSLFAAVGLALSERQQDPATADMQTEQTDLSGTYTGTFNCEPAGVSGETTLTITGNQFSLSDGKSGRIVASTTRGYTAVAMQFGETTAPSPGEAFTPPIIVSLRARKSGDRLTLTTVPGAKHVCSFRPAGPVSRRSRRPRGSRNTNISMNMNENNVNTGVEPDANANATPSPTP
jgi:hypothetical protein